MDRKSLLSIIFILPYLILYTNSIYSQSNDSAALSLKKGNAALLFSVGAEFKLGSIDGAMFSGKYHLSDRIALRMGAGINLRDKEANYNYHDQGALPISDESSTYTLNGYLVYYLIKKNIINPYLALGPIYTYNREYELFQYSDRYERFEGIQRSVGAGILFGAEWFFTGNMSLFAEYNPSFIHTKSEYYYYGRSSNGDYSEHEIGTIDQINNSVRLGLGIYF